MCCKRAFQEHRGNGGSVESMENSTVTFNAARKTLAGAAPSHISHNADLRGERVKLETGKFAGRNAYISMA